METNNALKTLAAEIVTATGCPIEVAREYVKAFLRCPEAQAVVIATAKAVL
jgi:hypothetical protein